ncbi:hypothetical protein ACFLU6_12900 [Acidobacteriota bacterium]
MPQSRNPNVILKRWNDEFARIEKQYANLSYIDNVFWQVHVIISANPDLKKGGTFQSWLAFCYTRTVGVMLRTFVDKRKDSVSLKSLLEDMKRHSKNVLTRDRFKSLYSSSLTPLAESCFDDIAGKKNNHIPKRVLQIEIDKLDKAFEDLKDYLNRNIAHLSKHTVKRRPTYFYVRNRILDVYEVMKRCALFLRAEDLGSPLPVMESTWLDVFKKPWLEKQWVIPEYKKLNELR